MQLSAKFEQILYMGFRATLNFRKFKVALNLMYRMLLNFAKSCISYPAYQNSGHSVAIVTYCVTKIIPTCSPVIGQFFDTMIVVSIEKKFVIMTHQNLSLGMC